MLQQKAEILLHENGFVLPDHNKNCLFQNTGNESVKHFLTKALIFKILRERGRTIGTEVELDGGVVDVLDVDNKIAYEIETNLDKRKIFEKLRNYPKIHDIFFIDTREVPNNFTEAENYLRVKLV